MMGEIPEEWKDIIVIPIDMKDGKQRVENYIAYLVCFIKGSKVFIEKLKAQAKQFLLVCQNALALPILHMEAKFGPSNE